MDESTLGFIFALIFAAVVLLLIYSGLLMLACRIAGVRVPAFSRAALIVIIAIVANVIAGVILAIILGVVMSGQSISQDPAVFTIITQSMGVLLGLFIHAGIYCAMLPTSYIKGMILYIIQIAVMIAVGVVIALIFSLGIRL